MINFKLTSLLYIFLFMGLFQGTAQIQLNKTAFQTPPQSAKVNTWWHWISGNITKDGITKDLESMKQQGISQATILNVGGFVTARLGVPEVKFNSPEWYEMFQWALKEASRLDIKIGVQNCDGWSTSGGPWITPELSMKQYVWSKTTVDGGLEINLPLVQPNALKDFYRDVAIVAFPIEEKLNSFQKALPEVKLNNRSVGTILADGNPKSELVIKNGDKISFVFDADFQTNKMVVFQHVTFSWEKMATLNNQFTLSSSVDGINFTKIADLDFVGINKSITATFPETNAKFFQLECTNGNCPVAEIELLKDNESPAYSPQVPFLLEKTASVFAANENVYENSTISPIKGIAGNSIIDLTNLMSSDGILKWKAPKGRWQIIRFGYTTTGIVNSPATTEGQGLEVDKMDSAALTSHYRNFAYKLVQSSGKFKGNTFKFLLIDSWECQFQTWTKAFPEEFKNRRGYDILPWIPVLCGETVENTKLSEAFLYDFRKTISDLIDQNYYKHFSELCHKDQLEMHAEVIYSNYGMYPPLDILKSNQYVDLPMTEFWANPNSNQFPEYKPADRPTAGFPTYATLADNKQIIGSEAYTGFAHYTESPSGLKPFGDAGYCSGINQIILHSYVLQPFDKKPGVTLGKFAGHFNRNNPWWEYAQDWMNYQSRIQYVLQKGEPVVDVIFYVGDELPQYFSRSFVNDLPYGFQANACNFEMLKNKAKVVDGKINFGGKQSFPILTLPKSQVMEYATLQRIAELVNDGAIIYGPKPTEMLSVPDLKNNTEKFRQLTDALWGNSGENKYGKGKIISGKPVGEVLNELHVAPDFSTNSSNPKEIMFIHKKLGDADVYFVFNQQNKPINRELIFRISSKTPEIWNPENGTISKPAIFAMDLNSIRIPILFNALESKIIVFKNEKPTQFIQAVSLSGKQKFPAKILADTTFSVPEANLRNGKFEFSSNRSGEYSFMTHDNQIVKANLIQPKIMEISNFKGKIEFFPISAEVIAPIEITKLKSLTEYDAPEIKYFAGKAKYTITFASPNSFLSANDSIVLNLGEMDATAEVRLNGKLLAYAWLPNTELKVSGLLKQENILEVTVADVCRNRFIGDLIQFGKVKSLFTTSPITEILNKDMPLKPSGLMGPLKLIKHTK